MGLSPIGYTMAGLATVYGIGFAFVGQDEAVNCSGCIGAVTFVAIVV